MIDASKLPTVPREVAQVENVADQVDQAGAVEYARAPEASGNYPSTGRPPATQRDTR